jgi:sugar phosphate isomerase/epimerase
MKIGIFAKTLTRPTIEELFQSIASYGIYSVQFNLSCAGLETLPENVPSELVQQIADSAEQAKVELSAISGKRERRQLGKPRPETLERVGESSLTNCHRPS